MHHRGSVVADQVPARAHNAGAVGIEPLAALTYKADQPRWVADHEPVRRHILRDYRTGANQRKGTHRHARQHGAAPTDGRALADRHAAHRPVLGCFEGALWSNRPGPLVVEKAGMWPDKRPARDASTPEQRDVVF